MPHLSLFDRVKIVYLFNKISNGVRDKYSFISNQAKTIYQISISESGVRRLIKKWKNTNQVADRLKTNVSKCLISKAGLLAINEALLKNPFLTAKKLKCQLSLIASTRTICHWINRLGWRKVNTKYCQIVSPVNRCKRFIFACFVKKFGENFDNSIAVDECTVELRQCTYKNWTKDDRSLRAVI